MISNLASGRLINVWRAKTTREYRYPLFLVKRKGERERKGGRERVRERGRERESERESEREGVGGGGINMMF